MSKKSLKKVNKLSHQNELIKFLDVKCKEQHGIILYHQMGTGKTLTSLFYIQATKSKNNVLLCPDELLVVWENELKKLNLKINIFKYVITYTNIKKLLNIDISDCTLIMDEAHNIIQTINNNDRSIGKNIITKLQNVKKSILLTGTPIYNNETDILYLFNISAGKNIVPYQKSKFKEEFFKVKIVDAVIKGWGIKLLSNNFFGKFVSNIGYANLAVVISNLISGKQLIPSVISKLIVNTNDKINSKSIKYFYGPATDKFMSIMGINETNKQNFKLALPQLSFQLNTLLLSILSMIAKTIDKYDIEDYYTMDQTKFKRISPYISYLSIEKESEDFPKSSYIEERINYSQYQMSVWVQLLLGEFNSVVNDDDDDLFENISNEDEYINKGRIVGNLTNSDEFPLKFIKVTKTIKNFQAVVYSNFYQKGSVAFGKYLDTIGIKYDIITPQQNSVEKQKILDNFYKNKIQVIILHPKITEGISILGARQLHILEPIINKSNNDQLIGRVIRYQSHMHLPLGERDIKIYNWVSVAETFLSILNKKVEMLKRWYKNYKAVPPMYLNTKYNKDITPDLIISSRSSKLNNFINMIKDNSKLIPDTCGKL